ncbi:MAG: hypothetical protein WC809_20015 [Sinimarinibacterium sp.]|jgi:hypothetical protein
MIAFVVIVLFTVAPLLSVFVASAIARAAGAELDEGGPHPCRILGVDIGRPLYSMFVVGWLGLLTIPIGLLALVVYSGILIFQRWT